ncbi:MAG: NlpC/P60 family protein [Firmicutes bacterium]|nr:NlpC/P60 family protein [Bacillota bacterium]
MDLLKKFLRLALITAAMTILFAITASADTGLVRASGGLNLRTGMGTNYDILCVIPNGSLVEITGWDNGWYSAIYKGFDGFVSSQYITIRKETLSRSGGRLERTVRSQGEEIVEYAKQYLGYKYTYGGSSPSTGFDCSGFTSYVYKQFGYAINRTAAGQTQNGIGVSWDELEAGDLLIFSNSQQTYGHVGIYMGDGYFIHSVQTGTPVSITSLWGSNYGNRLKVARRIIY